MTMRNDECQMSNDLFLTRKLLYSDRAFTKPMLHSQLPSST